MRWNVFLVAASFLLAASLPTAAQINVDMNHMTCGDWLGYSRENQDFVRFWMSGWFSYQTRRPFVDLILHQKNIANLKAWCQYHPQDSVMTGLQAGIGPQ